MSLVENLKRRFQGKTLRLTLLGVWMLGFYGLRHYGFWGGVLGTISLWGVLWGPLPTAARICPPSLEVNAWIDFHSPESLCRKAIQQFPSQKDISLHFEDILSYPLKKKCYSLLSLSLDVHSFFRAWPLLLDCWQDRPTTFISVPKELHKNPIAFSFFKDICLHPEFPRHHFILGIPTHAYLFYKPFLEISRIRSAVSATALNTLDAYCLGSDFIIVDASVWDAFLTEGRDVDITLDRLSHLPSRLILLDAPSFSGLFPFDFVTENHSFARGVAAC